MTDRKSLRDWLFKKITVENTLDKLEADGLQVRSAVDTRAMQRILPLENFPLEIRSKAMKAVLPYLAFFCFENSVRSLVMERLSENHKSGWWETKVAGGVKKKVEGRKTNEGKNRWHISRGEHEIYYTDFGDLKSIIQNNWVDFEDLFPDLNWITSRLDELENSRNIIAHSNNLEDREIDRIKLYLDDWNRQVG